MLGYHGRVRGSTIARLLRPPRYREHISAAQWERSNKLRVYVLWIAVVIDVAIWLALRNDPTIDRAVLERFAVINISILSVDGVLAIAAFRYAALRRSWVIASCAALEGFTVLVWIQATGTLSSYFVLFGALVIVAYRLAFDFTTGAASALSMIALHAAAIGLELGGVLRPEALFAGAPSRVYQVQMYQWMAVTSIASVYVAAFVGANAYINKLREKEHALREVRREADAIAERVRHGRLSGLVIADDLALGELLGRGGMGEIYMARRVSDETSVAVKVLHPHLVDSGTALERFRREARAAERIPSEFTACILEVGTDDEHDVHYIVMEYLRGEDMGALLRRRGPLGVRELLPIARKIAQALDAAHAVDVVHRDLKPSNVFLVGSDNDDELDVRLLDFGISKMLDDTDDPLTRADAVLGTIGYMAPEQALSQLGPIGPAADRFSFAAMLYRALCGRAPFAARDVAGAIHALLKLQPPAPSSLRPELNEEIDAVLKRGMAKAPADRYDSAMAMVEELELAAASCTNDTTERPTALTMPTSTLTAPPTFEDS